MAKTNAERQAEYRARQAAKRAQARGADELRFPARLDTQVSASVLDKLHAAAAHSGQSMGVIVERALIEYLSRHLAALPAGDHYVYPRDGAALKLGERAAMDMPPD